MKIVTVILVILVVLFLGFWGFGVLQPREYVHTGSKDMPLSVIQTWFKLTDINSYAEWHPDIEKVVWENDLYGLGAEYTDHFKSGDRIRLRNTEYLPFKRFVSTIADEELPFSASWTFELEKIESGTRLTITEHSEITSPFIRALYAMMKPDTNSVDKFLTYFR